MCVVSCLFGLGSQAAGSEQDAQGLARVRLFADVGAYDSALRLIDALQPPPSGPTEWAQWERARYTVYRNQSNWNALAARLASIPAEIPLILQQDLLTEGAQILIQTEHAKLARRYLRELLWRGSGDSVQVGQWRRLVIRSYLAGADIGDAQIAVERYQTEYLPADKEWDLLYARILLRSNHPEQAAAQLGTAQSGEGRLLRLLSRLRAGVDHPEVIVEEARRLQERSTDDNLVHNRLWAVIAEAAEAGADDALHVQATEQYLNGLEQNVVDELFAIRGAELWRAYRRYAERLGNEHNLLIGHTESWIALAERLESSNPLAQRAIYALLAQLSEDQQELDAHHDHLYAALKRAGMEEAAAKLYLTTDEYSDAAVIPASVRHRLVRYAIRKRDLPLAARMAAGLRAGPDQDPVEWSLIRARLAIYGGRFADGVAVLQRMIEPLAEIDDVLADRLIQVVFDLQSVGYHKAAAGLLEMLFGRVQSEKHKREILFWMADSKRAEGQHEEASELYLQSASYGGDPQDLWGSTARLHAAEVLTDAGFVDDARRIYEQLIAATDDRKQIIALERRLQELWLKRAKTTEPANSGG